MSMDEIKFHDSVADRFRAVATDITAADADRIVDGRFWPEIEGVNVVGYIREGVWGYRVIVWYEGRYLSSPYTPHSGWEDTSTEEDETFVAFTPVAFTPTKPRKITRYIWR